MTALESLLTAAGLLIIYRHRPTRPPSWRFPRAEFIALLKESAPMAVTTLLVLLFMKLDQMLVARILGFQQLGIYSSAVRLLDLCNFLPLALLPRSSRSWSG